MLGLSPTPGKRATLVIPKLCFVLNEPNLLELGNKQKSPSLVKQGGLYAWIEPHPRKTRVLVILLIFEFIKISTKKHSTLMESLCWGPLYCKLSDSTRVLDCKLDRLPKLCDPCGVDRTVICYEMDIFQF